MKYSLLSACCIYLMCCFPVVAATGIAARLGLNVAHLAADEFIDFSTLDDVSVLDAEQVAALALPSVYDSDEFPLGVAGIRPLNADYELLLISRQGGESGDVFYLAVYGSDCTLRDYLYLGLTSGKNTFYTLPATALPYDADSDTAEPSPMCMATETTLLRTDVAGEFDVLRQLSFAPLGNVDAEPLWQIQSLEHYTVDADGHIVAGERRLRGVPSLDVPDERLWQRRADLLASLPASDTTALDALNKLCLEARINDAEIVGTHEVAESATPESAPDSVRAELLAAVIRATNMRRTVQPQYAAQWLAEHRDAAIAGLLADEAP